MKVRLSETARTYLREETKYLKDRSSAAARAFTATIAKARQNLGTFAALGFESEDLPIAGMRRLVAGTYLLDYEMVRGEIHIVSIRSSRQLPPTVEMDSDFDYEARDTITPPGG